MEHARMPFVSCRERVYLLKSSETQGWKEEPHFTSLGNKFKLAQASTVNP